MVSKVLQIKLIKGKRPQHITFIDIKKAIHFNSRRKNLEMNREICKEKYVSTEMNCRQMSVIVHPSANKLA